MGIKRDGGYFDNLRYLDIIVLSSDSQESLPRLTEESGSEGKYWLIDTFIVAQDTTKEKYWRKEKKKT